MTLAVLTGVPPREWVKDPVAMGTAVIVLERLAEQRKR